MSGVTLQRLLPRHLVLLGSWLRQPHVAPWFPEPDANLRWAAHPPPGGSQAIIASGADEVGYLRWQRVDRNALDSLGLYNIPANSVDADILIGVDASLGRGLGPAALDALAATVREDPSVPMLGLTSAVANVRAHRAFEKAGYRIVGRYDPNGFGPCYLFTLDLRAATLPRVGGRIVLRRLSADDLQAFQSYRHDVAVGAYQGWLPQSDADARAFLVGMHQAPLFQPGVWIQLGVALPDTDELIGDIGVCVSIAQDEAELGFTLRRESQGLGLAGEAVREAIAMVFQHTRVDRIVCITDSRNTACIRLLDRLGMQRSRTLNGTFRGEDIAEHTFVMPRAGWRDIVQSNAGEPNR